MPGNQLGFGREANRVSRGRGQSQRFSMSQLPLDLGWFDLA